MKHRFQKLIALVLALVMALSLFVPVSAQSSPSAHAPQTMENLQSIEQYEAFANAFAELIQSRRTPLWQIRRLVSFLFGNMHLMPGKKFPVRVDDEITGYCNYIKDNADLDIVDILTNLPETKAPAELIVRVFRIDTDKMRASMYEKRDKYWGEGNYALSGIYYFLGVYFSVMESCDVTAVPTDDPDVHEVILRLTYRDGAQDEVHPGIFINSVTGEAYNKDGSGLVSTGFNCSIYDLLVYAPINAWMRNFGFTVFYDLLCYSSPDWVWTYTTRRFRFDYAGKSWMIQLWKGNYSITNGGEIGVYTREQGKIGTFYSCASDDEMLEMSMRILHGNEELFSLGPAMHWWINGFKMGKVRYEPSSLTMEATIVMRDREMLEAFTKAIDRNYRHDVSYAVDGLTVYLSW